jgi:hypothetical protein
MGSAIKNIFSVGVLGLALMGGAMPQAFADEARSVAPARGLMLDVGSKHTVSYFVSDEGKCNLTLMVGEKADDNGDHSSVGARVRVSIEGGKAAVIETAEGKSLQFTCAAGATSMSVRPLEVLAYSGRKS